MKKIFQNLRENWHIAVIVLGWVIILLGETFLGSTANAMTVTYTPLSVPNINSSWKTWMPYTAVTNRASAQYKLRVNWGWTDNQGFRRVNGERVKMDEIVPTLIKEICNMKENKDG